MIPEAAVEAAAAYVHEQFHGSPLSVYKDGYQRDYKDTIRHALELAAPIMRQEFFLEMNLRAVEDELRTPIYPRTSDDQ